MNLLTAIITAHEGGENVVVDAADMAGNASAAAATKPNTKDKGKHMNRTEWNALTDDQHRSWALTNTSERTATKSCYTSGCQEPPGTPWGPYWCAQHDAERLDRISRELGELQSAFQPNVGDKHV